MKDFQVLAVGAVVLDYIFVADQSPNRDEKKRAEDFVISIGGPSFTALSFLRSKGLGACFVGNVGDDLAGRSVTYYCQEHEIQVPDNFVVPHKETSAASIWVERNYGTRTVMWAHSDGLDQPVAANLDLRQFSLLLCDGHNIDNAIALARGCRNLGIPVLMDAGSSKAREEQLLSNTTHLIASSRYLDQRFPGATPLAASTILLESYPQMELVGFTLGSGGFQGRSRYKEYIVEGLKVSDLKDTTGAGDIFHGAFGYALLRTDNIEQALQYANFCAAQACQYYGSVNAVAQMQQVNKVLWPGRLTKGSFVPQESRAISA